MQLTSEENANIAEANNAKRRAEEAVAAARALDEEAAQQEAMAAEAKQKAKDWPVKTTPL